MQSSTVFPVLLVAACGLVGCDSLQGMSFNSTSDASGEVLWTMEWGAKPEFERTAVVAPLETDDPLATGESQLKKITELERNSVLLSFDIHSERSELLMSILESVDRNPFANIWTTKVDGPMGVKSRITEGPNLDLTPTYVPNEDAILFSSNRAGSNFSIFKKRTQGGGVQLITGQNSQDVWPQIDPTTHLMLFTQVRDASTGNGILWMRPIEGGAPTQVGEGEEARWSPDGKMLLYTQVNAASHKRHIWVRSVEGSGGSQITEGNFNDITPCWSPDGKRIVFASDRATTAKGQPNFDIYVMQADSSGSTTKLTGSDAYDDYPRWIDTDTIVFRSNRGKVWNIWSMRLSKAGG